MRRAEKGCFGLFLGLALALWVQAPAQAAVNLVPLSRPGVWSAVSEIIGYRGRIWFVNSEKFVNHNSADLYTYDPATGESRYERSLFSQDAGEPAVSGGLLYWPFEDPRFSASRGEFMVTNGRDWDWRVLPEGVAFHVHAMTADRGTLYAAISAWRAGLLASTDAGATWKAVHDHPTPKGRVSRITSLAVWNGTLYAGLTGYYRKEVKLLRLKEGVLSPVPGWPPGFRTAALAVHGGWLYGVNEAEGDASLWRTDGERFERLERLKGQSVRDLASDGRSLWAVTAERRSGRLWRSGDGVRWAVERRFRNREPVDVAVVEGRVYVGTLQAGGGGELWGPSRRWSFPPSAPPLPLPRRADPLEGEALARALTDLDRALADPASYAAHGERLKRVLQPFVLAGRKQAGVMLSPRLLTPVPKLDFALFGGAVRVSAEEMARWYLLRIVALSGHGSVPPAWLAVPWNHKPNRAEKYFHPAPAAAWAVARLKQDDRRTIRALIRRLDEAADPPWLLGDVVGALTVLTGKRFGYDKEAWRAWWGKKEGGGTP